MKAKIERQLKEIENVLMYNKTVYPRLYGQISQRLTIIRTILKETDVK